MSIKFSILEEDGIEFPVPTEKDGQRAVMKAGIPSYNVRRTGEVQTTSTNNVDLNGMSITPPAGKYVVYAFAQPRHFSNNGITWYAITLNNSVVSDTEYQIQRGGGTANSHLSYVMCCEVEVDGSTPIKIRWRSQSGTARTFGRFLQLIKVQE